MARNNTKKIGKKTPLHIPEIKRAFDTISTEAHRILRNGGTTSEQVKAFQKVWKTIFHRPVSDRSAEDYLSVKRMKGGDLRGKRKTMKKGRGQKGGAMPLGGAPIDYTTRPGIDSTAVAPYGSFPSYQSYQSAGLAIGKEGMFQECGTKDFTPVIDPSITQKGGTVSDFMHLAKFSPVASSSPPSILQSGTDSLKGYPPMASADPSVNYKIKL